ncbi:hypothetical protein DPEC_G00078280 [Dallia pectoralis]|uniref:Uncharacterized protein n=1 Tax=Dallia pectoralis TaxID=75939 RepID=A0ACC2H401_DALPE|nr:hypothetical protein DPEC_G00078280 [Dallia pectoralis]
MPEMTENQTPGHTPRKKKNKESHNAVERQRKEKINAGINRIGDLLPCSQALKQSKNMILEQAHRYITELQKQNDAMLLEKGDRIQAEEIRRLRRQLEELRNESGQYIELLKAHNINFLDDPTIHWKGKLRCAKVAKVTPTHQLPKRIIVYSNGNVIGPAGKEPCPASDLAKQPAEALIVQSSCDVAARIRVNGALGHVSAPSSAPPLLPGATLTPAVSRPGIRPLEQCLAEAPSAPKLPPSVSYITVQGLCPLPPVNAALPQQPQPATSAQSVTASPTTHLPLQPVASLAALPPVLTTQNAAIRTLSYTTVPCSSTLLSASAAGSTQTTWTTLQLTGNTVQPVCKFLPAPETSTTGLPNVHKLSVSPVATKSLAEPVHIQMRPQPITAHVQAQPSVQRAPRLQPAVLVQPQCAALPQPAVLAHSAMASQTPPTVLQQAAALSNPQTDLTQPKPAMVPQAAVLPLLQTMQVLKVSPAGTTVSAVTAPQSTNSPSVVILQQANPCSAQVVREDIPNQNPCQHIVIIQASNQPPPAPPQNPQVGAVSAVAPIVPAQVVVTSSTTSSTGQQIVVGKQLVHILPRPVPPVNPSPAPQAPPAAPVPTAPQTITVNGQVFSLQPMQTSDKSGSQRGQSSLQLIQPSTAEEPTTNVALHTLGALSSLNQSISQGMASCPSTQSNIQLAPAAPSYSIGPQQQPPSSSVTISPAPHSSPIRQAQVRSVTPSRTGLAVARGKVLQRQRGAASVSGAKKATPKRSPLVKKKVPKPGRTGGAVNTTAKPVAVSADRHKQANTVAHGTSSSSAAVMIRPPVSTAAYTPGDQSVEAITAQGPAGCLGSPQSTPAVSCGITTAVSGDGTSQTRSRVNSVIPCTSAVGIGPTQTQPTATSATLSADQSTAGATVCSLGERPAVAGDVGRHIRPKVTENRQPLSASTVPGSPAATNGSSSQRRSTVTGATLRETCSAVPIADACGSPACAVGSVECRQVLPVLSAQLNPSQGQTKPASSQETNTTTQGRSKPGGSPSVPSTPTPGSSTPSLSLPSVTVPSTVSEYRKRVTYNRPSMQQTTTTAPGLAHHTEQNVTLFSGRRKEGQSEGQPDSAMERGGTSTDSAPSGRSSAIPQHGYSLDHESLDQTPSRQTDSPMSGGTGRGFSVASMLPTGHSVSTFHGPFGPFPFTTEQVDILAMLEQDCPGRKAGGCPLDNPSSTDAPTWEPSLNPKSLQASDSKDRGTGQQTKMIKPMETPASKPQSARCPVGEAAGTGPSTARHPQNISYSQTHSHSQAQTQNQAQSGTVGTLSVNNLIRPSSRQQQAYPGSPSLTGQQASVPSPAGNIVHVSQPSTPGLPPCSGSVQLNEYTPVKSGLMRAQVGVGEQRQAKDVSKRLAQDDPMLSGSSKRQKSCPSTSAVGRVEVKPQDHGQMMAPQIAPGSSAIMTRINSDTVGTLFSGNTFMNTVLRPPEGHCTPQLPQQEHNPPGVLHMPQGPTQHSAPQTVQHLGGNPYMKQQQQQELQRHQLYQLQHHLTQPDPAQLHSLHQRALQQDQRTLQQDQRTLQQEQHIQKKRGLVRAGQGGLPLQQQIQQQHFGPRHQEKICEAQPGPAGPRVHHGSHLAQQDHLKVPSLQSGQDHTVSMQRLMSTRTLEQQLISQPTNPASRPSDLGCAPSRQERHRVSSYSAEALIGKSPSSGDQQQQQRMGLHLQASRGASQEQADMRGYLDTSRGKANIAHSRLPLDHPGSADVQRVSECPPFKTLTGAGGGHQLGGFEVQVSRSGDMSSKSGHSSQKGPQGQQGGFRMGPGPAGNSRPRVGYSGPHSASQGGVQIGASGVLRDQEGCPQSFMQSLLEQTGHQRAVQCCPPVSMEYNCGTGGSTGDMQAKASSPSVASSQKAPAMRLGEGIKGHLAQGGGNMGHPGVRAGLTHPLTPHSNSEPCRTPVPPRPPTAVSQRSRHVAQEGQSGKPRPGDRLRSGTQRPGNPFEPEVHLLGRPQPGGEARRGSIVRFMADSAQVAGDNSLVPDQHLAQNFGFPFIPEGGMNPASINANSTFIPPVSQPNSSRTSTLLPGDPQNTLASFYPSYSPAAHPSLASDIPLQYFSNQMFTSPGADKGGSAPLNNRFGSILSPPRPVGFAQASFPLLSDMPPMAIGNSSGITPHLSNFSLTSLFPEIATVMPPDSSAMPMSPLLSLSNTSSADSGKQPNRPAHNISHILGHAGSSAV